MTAPTPQEIEALLARVPEGHTDALQFEPQPHFGTRALGEVWPFGYLSLADGLPVFELRPLLGLPVEQMTAVAERAALAPELATALRSAVEEIERRDATVAEVSRMLAELSAKLDAQAAVRDAKLASIEAGVTALAEERDRLAARSYELAVAIMGGEDAPGYADSVDTETLVEQLRGDRRRERVESERLAAENARLRAECARQANVLEGGDWSDDLAEPPHA